MMDTTDTKKVSKIILLQNNKVLLLYSEKLKKFQFPGGHLNETETYIQALKRELYEETGLELSNYKVFFKKPGFVLYYGKPKFGTVKLSKEHSKYVWADIDNIYKYPLCKFTRKDIASFIKYKVPPKKNKVETQSDVEDLKK